MPEAQKVKLFIGTFLVLLLTLPLLVGLAAPPAISVTQSSSLRSAESSQGRTPLVAAEDSPLPGPDLATCNWTSNHILNPGFESWSDPQTPTGWGAGVSGNSYQWFATQPPWHVHQGTYSAGLQCSAPNHHYAYAFICQYTLYASMANLTLRFDWYLDQNLDPSHDCFYLWLQLTDGSNWLYLRYTLNGTYTTSNTSQVGYFALHDPPHQWNTFSRNVTADFLAIPTFPKPIPPGYQLRNLYVYLWATGTTNNPMCAFVDDMSLKDGTTVVIGSSARNGDFETPLWNYSAWCSSGSLDAADARQSSTAHSGTWSLNVTAASVGNSSYAYQYADPYARLTTLNQGWLNFWWRLTYVNAAVSSRAYVFFYCTNATQTFYVYYLLGYGGATAPWSNDSYDLYLTANQFNATGTWVAFHRNLWQDAGAYFHTSELFIGEMYLYVETATAASRISLLVDDTALNSAALNDASYEDQGSVGSEVRGWNWEDPAFTVTSTAYSGSKAANLTVAGGAVLSMYQGLATRPLNSTRETYLDVMWRLEAYTPNANTYAYVVLNLEDGHSLCYFIAVSAGGQPSNDSGSAWFNVTGLGTTGAWIAMHRDLAHDYQAVFGSLPNTAIDAVSLCAQAAAGPRLVLLLDDFYLYDDPAPRISNVQRTPGVPGYMEAVQVTATVVDQDLTTRVLHYRLNSTTWQQVAMTPAGGSVYGASIPGQPYGTVVDYYLTANDTWGMLTIALNGGSYWTYTIPPATTTTTTTGPAIPGFPWAAILIACSAALCLGVLRRRRCQSF
jgi:hypothetical protein